MLDGERMASTYSMNGHQTGVLSLVELGADCDASGGDDVLPKTGPLI